MHRTQGKPSYSSWHDHEKLAVHCFPKQHLVRPDSGKMEGAVIVVVAFWDSLRLICLDPNPGSEHSSGKTWGQGRYHGGKSETQE